MICFSVFLLFGSQIQHLWVASAADIVFEILSTITFAFFIMDMTIRIIAEPNYFNFELCWYPHAGGGFYGGENIDSSNSGSSCVLGGFMFWCDLVSTGALLNDISLVNQHHYGVEDVEWIFNWMNLAFR